ncbi:MAG: hypothetical protein ACFFAQ_01985 [Promethearchaeota archaeon]
MIKASNFDQNNQLPEEEGFRQLDLLYKIYKLDNQREILLKKLHKLQKTIKKNPNEDLSIKLKALKKISNEIVQNKKIILSQVKDSHNFFELSNQIKKLKQYILHLDKAIKRKEIDANTHRITKNYYEEQLKLQFNNLNKVKRIVKEYIIILKNQELQLRSEERFGNSNVSKKIAHILNGKNVKSSTISRQNALKENLDFLIKYILKKEVNLKKR